MVKKKTSTGFSLKDHLFNRESVEFLADQFENTLPGFEGKRFVRDVLRPFKTLELKERILHISKVLEHHLDADFKVAVKQILHALPPPLDPTKSDDDFGEFIIAPLGEYVVRNGLSKRHLKTSLRTLKEITKRFSMEFAVRPFLNAYPKETLAMFEKWAVDKNYHVRRLVSEGSRPSLPWSGKISIDQKVAISFLDKLHADPTRYVTRSVCNHLNDISKTDPKLAVDILRRWREQQAQAPNELDWMSKHAMRTLVKQGDKRALKLLGFRANPKISVSQFQVTPLNVSPGDAIEIEFQLTAARDECLIVDYVIEFVKANGTLSPKVHKIKRIDLEKGESRQVKKRHLFRANATTYTLYPGTHYVSLQINGKIQGRLSFDLV